MEREFEVVDRRGNWGEEVVYFHDLDGELRLIPVRWTNLAAPDAFVTMAAGRCGFRVQDLVELTRLLGNLKR